MAEVFGFESSKFLVRRGGTTPSKSAAFVLVLGASLLLSTVFVSAQSPSSPRTKKTPQAAANPAATEPAAPPPAQIWLPPVQAPQHVPVIAWDGKLLTIDADNSSLSDILLAIRSHTGASIEMPGSSTSRERIAIHLGPAPVREVLSSLLYGTDFNYVVLSSEDDETALGKVIITARDGDDSDDTVTADTRSDPAGPANPKMRLMPGYAAPGKRDFEVALQNKIQDEESSSSVAETPAADASAPVEDQPSVAAGTDPNPANSDSHPVASAEATDSSSTSSSSSDSAALTAAQSVTRAAAAAPGSSSDASSEGDTSTVSHMEQTLQKMYQQRQQLQAQQNRATQTPAP